MSLIKLVESYKKKMSKVNYDLFFRNCHMSVNLYAKNTKNHNNKDLAEYQISCLAERYL